MSWKTTPRRPIPPPPSLKRRRARPLTWLFGGAVALFLACGGLCFGPPVYSWVAHGILVLRPPKGTPVPSVQVDVSGLRRGYHGQVSIRASALYTDGPADRVLETPLVRYRPRLFLVNGEGEEIAIKPEDGWSRDGGRRVAEVVLPDVPDGDYKLRARLSTPIGPATAEVEIPLYAPAVVHMATDRPLYKPGQTIMMRAVTLAMGDLAPIEGRPGRFTVTGPSGLLLEEEAESGPWGVVATDLPLAADAPSGTYLVGWRSGGATDSIQVEVKPFAMPRFAVDVETSEAWYGPGGTPGMEGRVRYTSGAPVEGARVELVIHDPQSQWPLPTSWATPESTLTDAGGAFSFRLPAVPDDLAGHVAVPVTVIATDPAGETQRGGALLRLSSSPVVAAVETELSDGLVPDFPNRILVRVTTPDGQPLPGAAVRVRRAWDPSDPGVEGVADQDSVAMVLMDPGQPVSVLVPPPPARARPRVGLHLRNLYARELLGGRDRSLEERRMVDRWGRALEPCALRADGEDAVGLGVVVSRGGRVERVLHGQDEVSRCMAARLEEMSAPPGEERFYRLGWTVTPVEGPRLQAEVEGAPAVPAPVRDAIRAGRQRARECVQERTLAEPFAERLWWRAVAGSSTLSTRWIPDPDLEMAWGKAEKACVKEAFGDLALDRPAEAAAEGVARLRVEPGRQEVPAEPTPTTRVAYELQVTVAVDGQELGSTKAVVEPGAVPPIRLRAEEAVVSAGDQISIKVLRGPSFTGALPEKDEDVSLLQGTDEVGELRYIARDRTIEGVVPDGLHGLLEVAFMGGQVRLLAPRARPLALSVEPDRERYAPGESASITVTATEGGEPAEAGVSLMGVDETLGRLASLMPPDDWARVTVRAELDRQAFGAFDARALMAGRIRGENAVMAALQRVSHVAPPHFQEERVDASASDAVDPVVHMVESFYGILGEARRLVARWEADPAEGEVLTASMMEGFWDEAIKRREKAGEPVEDGYGRILRLDRLPPDLLELVDPRNMVTDATRLPEDVESWTAHVAGR